MPAEDAPATNARDHLEHVEHLDRLVAAGRLGLADDEVRLTPADPGWPLAFGAVRERIFPAVHGARVAHIGSTSVPGLPAKPLLDVSVGLAFGQSFDAGPAAAVGLEFRAVNPEATLFALYAPQGLRIANVHVRYRDTEGERWDLMWRDYLRAHPDEVAAYAAAKTEAAGRHRGRPAYSAAKGRFIAEASVRAVAWAARSAWTPPESPEQ